MRKELKFLPVLLIGVLFLSSCALNQLTQKDKMQQLQQGLDTWKSFRLDGIASFNFSGFNFYKNITITNNADSLKVVLYESGIFGNTPQPFAVLTLADSVKLKLPFPLKKDAFKGINHGLLDIDSISERDKECIITEHELLRDKTRFVFNERFLVNEISYDESNLKIIIEYDLEEKPQTISGYKSNKVLFQIEIDKFIIRDTLNEERT